MGRPIVAPSLGATEYIYFSLIGRARIVIRDCPGTIARIYLFLIYLFFSKEPQAKRTPCYPRNGSFVIATLCGLHTARGDTHTHNLCSLLCFACFFFFLFFFILLGVRLSCVLRTKLRPHKTLIQCRARRRTREGANKMRVCGAPQVQ